VYLAVRKNVTYIVRILSAYFPNFIVHRGQQQNNRSTWTPCVISSSKLPDTMKYFCIAGLDLPYISFVRPIMCEIIYVLYRTPWSSVRKFWVLVCLIIIIIIIIQFVSLYLISRVVGKYLKLRWASEASLMTSRIEQ